LAGLSAAELKYVAAGRSAAKVMIKCDDAVHIGAISAISGSAARSM
jgi:hypothetical protein